MQVPAPFDYERATGVEHAIGLLERLGEGPRLVAAGAGVPRPDRGINQPRLERRDEPDGRSCGGVTLRR